MAKKTFQCEAFFSRCCYEVESTASAKRPWIPGQIWILERWKLFCYLVSVPCSLHRVLIKTLSFLQNSNWTGHPGSYWVTIVTGEGKGRNSTWSSQLFPLHPCECLPTTMVWLSSGNHTYHMFITLQEDTGCLHWAFWTLMSSMAPLWEWGCDIKPVLDLQSKIWGFLTLCPCLSVPSMWKAVS